MRFNVAVIGGGSWGTTVAHLAAHNVETVLWARHAETVDAINTHHQNPAISTASTSTRRSPQPVTSLRRFVTPMWS